MEKPLNREREKEGVSERERERERKRERGVPYFTRRGGGEYFRRKRKIDHFY